MDRNGFLKNGLVGLGAAIVLPTAITSCKKRRSRKMAYSPNSLDEKNGRFRHR